MVSNKMNDKFFNLSKEKQDCIINAALAVFSEHDYKHASTDAIIQKAGISKGLLFHYFKSKKGLYLYLYHFCYELVRTELAKGYNYAETDFFKRIYELQLAKVKLMQIYPNVFSFLMRSWCEKDNAVVGELDKFNGDLIARSSKAVLSGIDVSKFKEGVDVARILKLLIWCADGIQKENAAKNDYNLGRVSKEYYAYFDMMKQGFYKEEYQNE